VPSNGVTTYQRRKVTACYGNNIAKLTAWVNPVFLRSTIM